MGGGLPGCGSDSATLQIRDVNGFSIHWYYSGWISPLGYMPTDRAEVIQEFVPPPTGDGDGRSGFGGGGDIRLLPSEHRRTVFPDETHHGSVPGGRSVPWGACVPLVVVTGLSGPVGDSGYSHIC